MAAKFALLLLVAVLGPSLSAAQYTDYDSDYDSTIHDVSTNNEPTPCVIVLSANSARLVW